MPLNPAQDQYAQGSTDVESQARGAVAITPSDTVDLAPYAKALYIGVAGNVKVIPLTNADDAAVTFYNHPVGYMPVQVRRVYATGTTATNIVGLYNNAETT